MKFETVSNIPQLSGKNRSECAQWIRKAVQQDSSLNWYIYYIPGIAGVLGVYIARTIVERLQLEFYFSCVVLIVIAVIGMLYYILYGFYIIPKIRRAIEAIEKQGG